MTRILLMWTTPIFVLHENIQIMNVVTLSKEKLGNIPNIRDFKQRQRGRRRERQKIREKPKGPLRMTGGKQVDVLRSGPT